ncbi:MAG: serine hydroxymethyltransferase [Candidatus Bathyarchaeia archaeon]
MSAELKRTLENHERWRREQCLNLIASENVTSPAVRKILGSDLGHRYTATDHFYMGCKFINQAETIARELVRDVFGSEWADVTPLSGHITDMTLLSTFARRGDKILTMSTEYGGYFGTSETGFPRILGLVNLYFPFDKDRWNIEIEKTVELIASEVPRLVILGASYILFPHPVQQIAKACRETGTMLAFDGSHVMGLIAGGAFQQPLKEGARILVGSTHKSFFGPQGGIIAGFKPEGERMKETIFPAIMDNAHWNRIAALAQALLEMKKFGRKYAAQVIRNSRALAAALDERGIPVRCKDYGYTASHQVLLDMDRLKDSAQVPDKLEHANVIVDRGIRLGTSEMTRRGMREGDMNDVAEIIAKVIRSQETVNSARRKATALARKFRQVRYA